MGAVPQRAVLPHFPYIGDRRENWDKLVSALWEIAAPIVKKKSKQYVTIYINRLNISLHDLVKNVDSVVRCDLWKAKTKTFICRSIETNAGEKGHTWRRIGTCYHSPLHDTYVWWKYIHSYFKILAKSYEVTISFLEHSKGSESRRKWHPMANSYKIISYLLFLINHLNAGEGNGLILFKRLFQESLF